MEALTDAMRERLDRWVRSKRIVLFMKGNPAQPQCGFSARVVTILDGLVDDYGTVDVLADANVREAMKLYAQWPTFPQLWVDGQLVGGCDIIEQMHETGDLVAMLGSTEVAVPVVTITDAARDRIREVTEGENVPLRLRIDARFRYEFEMAEGTTDGDVRVASNGIALVLDRASARRAQGMTLDFVTGPQGSGLVVDNPNEPAQVQQLSVEQLSAWMDAGEAIHLIDVRTDQEWSIARIEGAKLLDPDVEAWILAQPRDARLVFQCHHGMRSQHAAEHFLQQGFRHVFNLAGGIDAWSARVDPDVPRY